MAEVYRPKAIGGNYLGYQPVQIQSITFKTEDVLKYDWMDVKINVELKSPNSQYPFTMEIVGDYKKDEDGHITDNSLIRQIYFLIDAVGMDIAVDINGDFIHEETGEAIEDINSVFQNYESTWEDEMSDEYPYLVYVYREKGRKDPSKTYTSVVPKIVRNTQEGEQDLQGYVSFLKSNGVITEVGQEASTSDVQQNNPMESTDGIDHL